MGALAKPSQAVQRSEQLSQNADQFINWLFDELAGTFPAWKSAFDSQQAITTAKRIWFEALSENKIKRSEIQTGLKQARKSTNPFLPSVGQFLEWCRVIDYAELGLPDLEILLKRLNVFSSFGLEDASKFKFKSNAEYWLITDLYNRNRQYGWQDKTLRNQAERALNAMAKRIVSGEKIPPPNPVIEDKKKVPLDPRIQRLLDEQNQKGAMQ
ncbi:replication protein P [Actinobacillus minor]|uniref:replication protein P n=1 Tax=Actinobacillus minor TaxID=51047 RepID=UPI0023F10589|nr:replication protein P [Actinobacillus minor]MDD6911581.1 replication protein P [Actinobacillus minor]MDY4713533.1 replication protein P [Actinobacillus minor]